MGVQAVGERKHDPGEADSYTCDGVPSEPARAGRGEVRERDHDRLGNGNDPVTEAIVPGRYPDS